MQIGSALAGRYQLDGVVRSGGMGQVFRALDRQSGAKVAIKVIREGRDASATERFEREIAVLSGLRHPGIVEYVAHGMTPVGELYLAMEWLEGEDLCARLARGPLDAQRAIDLMREVAEALASAHAAGVVHRDIKPSNLWLASGEPAHVKLLDFGVAQLAGALSLTRTGALVGTPAYMAPEQIRGGSRVDARADVYALGCVLFECLTGTPVFAGENALALLAMIVFQEPPRLRDVWADAPPALDELVARMLAKEPSARPRDGAELVRELIALGAHFAGSERPTAAVTVRERRMISMLLVAGAAPPLRADASTVSLDRPGSAHEFLQQEVHARAGRLEVLLDGTALATFASGNASPIDQATQAARCALELRRHDPQLSLAIATGHAEFTRDRPLGDAIEQVFGRMFLHDRIDGSEIAIDWVTAALLGARFDLGEDARGPTLVSEAALAPRTHTLLGKATQCVGRDLELNLLTGMFDECVAESVARAVLVTGAAGMGKSRLGSELVQRLRVRRPELQVWMAASDPLRSGSPFALLRQLLLAAPGVRETDALPSRQQRLRAWASERLPPASELATFLGELLGVPLDAGSLILTSARRDPNLMSDRTMRAWLACLEAEVARGPLLIVLEDLQWADAASVQFVEAALRQLPKRSWMLLTLARPEVHERFPKLAAARLLQELRLRELTRSASEALVRQVLGEQISDSTLERLLTRADGHAFYLEELIRSVALQRGAALPVSVLAMVEARLAGLDAEARRVLRAASIFGEHCRERGVQALLGSDDHSPEVRRTLLRLAEDELLVQKLEPCASGEVAFGFRHELLREGAYAMLTPEDRVRGHALAAAWLEQQGEDDPGVLAEHFARGQRPEEATRYYLAAVQRASVAGDPDAMVAYATRGLDSCGEQDSSASSLHEALVDAYSWRSDFARAELHADAALRLSAADRDPPLMATVSKLFGAVSRGESKELILPRLMACLAALDHTTPYEQNLRIYTFSVGSVIFVLDSIGRFDLVEQCMSRARASIERVGSDAITHAWLDTLDAMHDGLYRDEPWRGLSNAKRALEVYRETGHECACVLAKNVVALNAIALGAFDQADDALRDSQEQELEPGRSSSLRTWLQLQRMLARGDLHQADTLAQQAPGSPAGLEAGRTHFARALIQMLRGAPELAESALIDALALLHEQPDGRLAVLTWLARCRLTRSDLAGATTAIEDALLYLKQLQAHGYRGAGARAVQLVHAELLHAAGKRSEARDEIARARDQLLASAEHIDDRAVRESFLHNVEDNARILSLARSW